MDSGNAATAPVAKELTFTRKFGAPPEVVFAAWTEAEQLARWFAPTGFDVPHSVFEARVGGKIEVHMRWPDGQTIAPMGGEVREIDPPRRLVFSAYAFPQDDGSWGLENLNTVTFEPADGGTLLHLHVQVLKADGSVPPQALAGMEAGWAQTLEKLAGVVNTEDTARREMVVSREYGAPVALVWEAWTNDKHADKWWGPNGFRNETLEHDFRVGGAWRFLMHGPDGRVYPNRKLYLAIEPQKRIVSTHGWDDENRPPVFIATVSFTDLGNNRTNVELRGTFPTVADYERVMQEVGATEGAKQTLARLGEYLNEIQSKQETK